MREVVYKAWVDLIKFAMQSELPKFQVYQKKEIGEEPGLVKYCWNVSSDLWCFIVFRPLDSEAFDVFIGWSSDSKCPYSRAKVFDAIETKMWDIQAPYFMTSSMNLAERTGLSHWDFFEFPEDIYDDPDAFSSLYAEHFLKDLSEEEARLLVRNAVDKGIAEIKEYGLPYLNKIIEKKLK